MQFPDNFSLKTEIAAFYVAGFALSGKKIVLTGFLDQTLLDNESKFLLNFESNQTTNQNANPCLQFRESLKNLSN